jgi:hypothetical protein
VKVSPLNIMGTLRGKFFNDFGAPYESF